MQLNYSLKQAKEELIRTIIPVTRGGIMELSNEEIICIICKVCKLLHKYVKFPAAEIVYCENILHHFMMLVYDDFSKQFFEKDVSKLYVEEILESIMKQCILTMSASL